jgi:hypothetical protein
VCADELWRIFTCYCTMSGTGGKTFIDSMSHRQFHALLSHCNILVHGHKISKVRAAVELHTLSDSCRFCGALG